MTKHLEAARYHRGQADAAHAEAGRPGGNYTQARSDTMNHIRAERSAYEAHARETGQQVVYTPIGEPVFRK